MVFEIMWSFQAILAVYKHDGKQIPIRLAQALYGAKWSKIPFESICCKERNLLTL